ncbi:hypothetical protein SAMN06295974_3825 [Plantibacter flavus]|uniref:Uncharacterized protein n=1 Tax=Plantibacter flavus TaxID=150123 RepID=A0A3N2BL93_9MICO|nr:hypothetical protein [Plantibacter flavus]ROR76029.1 hypothetical protein EDD42_3981 [Plantibacter flavus]SMG49148.1 hypothetical protein SAMN06295974_3825 [Plantibacter flavus]
MSPFDHESAKLSRAKNPRLTVFDTGEVLEAQPQPINTATTTEQMGWVDFENDESATILSIRVSPSGTQEDTTVINFDSLADGRIEIQRLGATVWSGEAFNDPNQNTDPTTVGDLDGSPDAANWLSPGHVLDASEVAYLRSLRLPADAGPSAVDGRVTDVHG